MPPRAKQHARRTRARTIAALEEFTQTLETTLDGRRAAHAAVGVGEQPAQQPTPTDIEISHQRAAELTAAHAEVAAVRAEVAAARAEITRTQAELTPARGEIAQLRAQAAAPMTPPPVPRPFTGQGNRLDE